MKLTNALWMVAVLGLVAACGDNGDDDQPVLDTSNADIEVHGSDTGTQTEAETDTGTATEPGSVTDTVDTGTATVLGSDTDAGTETGTEAGTDTASAEELAIAGVFQSPGGLIRLSADALELESQDETLRFLVVERSNALRYLIVQNPSTSGQEATSYSRFDWFEFAGDVHWCHAVTAAASADEARVAAASNQGDAQKGCGGQAWVLLHALALIGEHTEAYGTHVFSRAEWTNEAAFDGSVSRYSIARFDNGAAFFIAHNGASNAFNPGKWSRVEWTEQASGLYYCQTVFDALAEDDAADFTAHPAALRDDLTGKGCGGFPWTLLEQLEVVGDYSEAYGVHAVAEFLWRDAIGGAESLFHIARYSNADDYLIALNDAANAYNPGTWSRFEWTEQGGALYYCQTVYNAASQDFAADFAAHPAALRDDLAGAGCGGFPWTALTMLDVRGAYTEAYGWHEISELTWRNVSSFQGAEALYHIASYDNAAGYLVAENDGANAYNPGLWSRFEWAVAFGILYYCQTVYEAATKEQALDFAAHPLADKSNPAAGGCGDFPWTALSAVE